MTETELRQEMDKTIALLPEGCKYTFLRPPGGSASAQLKTVAREYGVALLNWSVDPRDWANHDAAVVEAAVVEQVRDGDIILLHDMCDCSVDAALSIIDTLQKQGFRFVTVSELAALQGSEITPGRMYTQFEKGSGLCRGRRPRRPDNNKLGDKVTDSGENPFPNGKKYGIMLLVKNADI